MRITAIRLRNVRRFDRDGLAIENIPPGLSMLAEPNEFGKSTLFDVLRVILFEKHSTKGANVRRLASASGSAPFIELDFIANKKEYRIRKQFLRSSFAELLYADTGEKLLADGEAHDWIVDLIGASKAGDGPTGLLWVEQGSSMVPPEAGDSGKTLLASLLEQEVGEVTGGERARLILKKVQDELSGLITKNGQPKTGRYKTLISNLSDVNDSIAEIQSKLSSAENLLIELDQLTQSIKVLENPEQINRFESELEKARVRLIETEKAHDLLRVSHERLEDKNAEVNRYKKDLENFQNQTMDANTLIKKLETIPLEKSDYENRIEKLNFELSQLRSKEEQIKNEREETEKIARLCREAQKGELAQKNAETLNKTIKDTEKLQQKLIELKGQLNLNQVSIAVLDKIKTANFELEKIRERLSADSTTITPYLTALGENIVTLDGKAITEKIDLSGSQVLSLGEYGKISIDSSIPNELKNDYENTRLIFEDLLSTYNVLSITDAEQKTMERREIENNIVKLQTQLDQLAPKGISHLKELYEAECAILNNELLSDEVIAKLPESVVAEQNWEYARKNYDNIRDSVNKVEINHSEARSKLNQLKLTQDQYNEQLKSVVTRIGDSNSWENTNNELMAKIENLTLEKKKIESEIEEKQNAFPTLEVARDDVKRFEESKENNTKKLNGKKIREAEVKRDLAAISEKGLEEELANLTQQKGHFEKQLSSLEAHVAALQLLESSLLDAQKSLQEQFLKPVSNELGPLLKIVFPNAEVSLGGNFNAEEFRRLERVDTIDTLSGGTREQIAVLTRLAFAQLMAKRGREMPVILDDALVWCDDNRLEDVFRAIRSAARDIQCIVLTCHEKGFSTLGAPVLELQKWPQTH